MKSLIFHVVLSDKWSIKSYIIYLLGIPDRLVVIIFQTPLLASAKMECSNYESSHPTPLLIGPYTFYCRAGIPLSPFPNHQGWQSQIAIAVAVARTLAARDFFSSRKARDGHVDALQCSVGFFNLRTVDESPNWRFKVSLRSSILQTYERMNSIFLLISTSLLCVEMTPTSPFLLRFRAQQ